MSDAEIVHQALSQEIGCLRHGMKRRFVRRAAPGFGISGKTPDEIARFLAGFVVDPAETEPPYADEGHRHRLQRMADDLRYYYIQAAIARPGAQISDIEVGNWLWAKHVESGAGRHPRLRHDCAEPSLARLAPTAMVPNHQRFRTKDG